MTQLLHISASPRGQSAASSQAAAVFLDALPSGVEVTTLSLFDDSLPEVTENVVNAKFKFAMGADLSDAEAAEWQVIRQLVEQFVSADHVLLAVPMWNFTIPYRMKQYIDLITHPGLTFRRTDSGAEGLAKGAGTVIYSRGGNYSPKDGRPDPFDYQSPYLGTWLGLVGIHPVEEVLVQNTMAGPDAQDKAVEGARDRLQVLAAGIRGA